MARQEKVDAEREDEVQPEEGAEESAAGDPAAEGRIEYQDGIDIDPVELQVLNSGSWDGKPKITSPFVEGDYLLVREQLPRISGREGAVIWNARLFGLSAEQRATLNSIFQRTYTEWRLTGLDGKHIGSPDDDAENDAEKHVGSPDDDDAFLDLSQRTFSWLVNRTIVILMQNPLA